MTQDEIIEMVVQISGCDKPKDDSPALKIFIAFAKLVEEKATEEANAKANASWTLMCKKMVAIEREACAKVCESIYTNGDGAECWLENAASKIRARGEQA
jgi:hypothetical protein